MTPLMERKADSREELRAQFTVLYRAGEAMVADGKVVKVILAEQEDDITTRQRGFLHAAVLPQIAEQVCVNGERYVAAIWKEYFRALFLPDRWVSLKVPRWDPKKCALVQPKRATPHRQRRSTEELGIKGYSDFIDKVIAHAASEFNVVFVFDEDEREAVRWKRPQRKQGDQA